LKKLYFLFVVIFSLSLFGQEQISENDLNPSIKELSDYHQVIYPIWHTAYPSKDYEMLRSMVDQVNTGAEKIYAAKLPGILRDKETKWKETLAGFKKSVEEYNSAVAGDNNEALLTAAEVLHTYYELMVRLIRPLIKELDDFHKTLYVVYHSHLPQKNYSRIKELTDEFILKATKVKEAKLPSRYDDRTDRFKSASNGLYYSCLALKEALYTDNSVLIENAVERLHSDYQKAEAVFD
jgi:hypothetical protein